MFTILLRPGVAAHAALVVFTLLVFSNAARAEPSLETIIENVRLNEELYRDIEVKWQRLYEIGKAPHELPSQMIKSMNEVSRCILQDDYVYLNVDGSQSMMNGMEQNIDTLQSYDGKEMRILEQQAYGNQIDERKVDFRVFRPHTVLLRRELVGFPLSTYLRGNDAMKVDDNGSTFDGVFVSAAYEGQEAVGEIDCARVRVDYFHGEERRQHFSRRILWLAPDRNYLPIRTEGYRFLESKDVPCEAGELVDLREAEPGIWFPRRAVHTRYDPIGLKERRKEVYFRETYKIEEVDLNPNYDVGFFERAVDFPPGIPVFVVRQGKIVKTFGVEQAPSPEELSHSSISGFRVAILVLNITAIIFIGFFLLKKYSRTSG